MGRRDLCYHAIGGDSEQGQGTRGDKEAVNEKARREGVALNEDLCY